MKHRMAKCYAKWHRIILWANHAIQVQRFCTQEPQYFRRDKVHRLENCSARFSTLNYSLKRIILFTYFCQVGVNFCRCLLHPPHLFAPPVMSIRICHSEYTLSGVWHTHPYPPKNRKNRKKDVGLPSRYHLYLA